MDELAIPASVPPPVGSLGLSFREVGGGLLAGCRGRWALLAGAVLQVGACLLPALGPLFVPIPGLLAPPPARPVVRRNVVHLVAPPNERRAEPLHTEAPKTVVPARLPPPPPAGPLVKVRAPVTIAWELDRAQVLPGVLRRRGGALGFASKRRVVYLFRAPDWAPIPLPEEGVNLAEFYYLRIDEYSGRYRFVDQVRRGNEELGSLTPYALLDRSTEERIKDEVRRIAGGRCVEGDAVEVTMRLDAVTDFQIVALRCVKPVGGAK